MMIGTGDILTVISSSTGVMVMSSNKSYNFATHLGFLPAVLVNFLGFWSGICNSRYSLDIMPVDSLLIS
ncbi:MAG: hypothetical protein ACXV7E_00405 [Methylobacter sp.]